MKKDIKILAIESSCDETAAAIICGCHPEWSEGSVCKDSSSATQNDNFGFPVILSNIVSSQIDLHAKTGGVVPEVASRAHMEAIIPVIAQALLDARQEISKQTDTRGVIPDLIRDPGLDSRFRGDDNKNSMSDLYSEAIKELQNNIDYIAVTAGPGLVGSLLVGFNAAKSLAYALDKPIIPVNHIEGHIYSAFAEQETKTLKQDTNKSQNSDSKKELTTENWKLRTEIKFPILSLTVSGGHTSLTLMKDHGDYENIGQTLDDAAGEAFDKVAKLLGLGYPGGPAVSKLASEHRNNLKFKISNLKSISNEKNTNNTLIVNCPPASLDAEHLRAGKLEIGNSPKGVVFPRPVLNDGTFNFSFSGLKTAVLQYVLNIKKENYYKSHPEARPKDLEILRFAQNDKKNNQDDGSLSLGQKQEICAAFEDSVVDVLTTKTMRAVLKYNPKSLILAGGVAANRRLRYILETKVDEYNCQLLSTDSKLNLLIPSINLCGDNAAMIGLAAYYHIQKNNISSWDKVKVDSNLEL